MSDTVIFGKTFKASFKACALYVVADACMGIGQAFFGMDKAEWDSWWWMQRLGWFLLQLGSIAILVKAFYSNSSKAKEQ